MASVLKVDKLDPQSGTALEIGTSGDTITVPSGATFTVSGTATGNLGITNAEQWHSTSNITISSADTMTLITPFSRYTSRGATSIGTNISSSSGIFSFGITGIYNVRFQVYIMRLNHLVQYAGPAIHYATDGATYEVVSRSYCNLQDVTNAHSVAFCETIIDVDSTSNCKLKMMCETSDAGGVQIQSNADETRTGIVFTRLGDT